MRSSSSEEVDEWGEDRPPPAAARGDEEGA